MATKQDVGHLQSLEYISSDTVRIVDKLYGTQDISEPVLVELLRAPVLHRLTAICQHGVTGLLGLTPVVTRFEHSVGAFLLVRRVGGSLEEQVTGLLHDISHTTLSHVIDWALSAPGESFHEVHKDRFLETTPLPDILKRHGFHDLKPFREELFPLVEMPAPHLCADRLDYALRDSVSFGRLELSEAQEILASLKAHPDATSPQRLLVLRDKELALKLSRAYMTVDRDVWSNPAHVDMARRAGELIGAMVRDGRLKEEDLWNEADQEFWERLRAESTAEDLQVIHRLESEGLPDEKGLPLPRAAKVRTLDPDVCRAEDDTPMPLSTISTEWFEERNAYISARQALRA